MAERMDSGRELAHGGDELGGASGRAGDLAPEQERALALLAAGKSAAEAAREIGVHRSTLHRWMKGNPAFAAAYNQWHEEMRQTTHSRLLMLAEKATGTLEKAIDAGDGRLAMRYLEKMGLAKDRETGPTEAEEIAAERKMESERKRVKRKKEASDLRMDEIGILDGI